MKEFNDDKELFLKVVSLQEEVKDSLQSYIETKNIGLHNYELELYVGLNKVAQHIFDELTGKSKNMIYLTDNMENLVGDAQILSAFLRAFITDQIFIAIVGFELDLEEEGAENHE